MPRGHRSNRAPRPLTRSAYIVGRSYINKWARCRDAQRHASWKFWRLTVSKGKPKRLIPFVFGTMPIIHNDAFDLAVEVWRCRHASCHFLASVKLSHFRVEFAGRHTPPRLRPVTIFNAVFGVFVIQGDRHILWVRMTSIIGCRKVIFHSPPTSHHGDDRVKQI